jgi:RNA polymerase sigma factor (sigma-70 family)
VTDRDADSYRGPHFVPTPPIESASQSVTASRQQAAALTEDEQNKLILDNLDMPAKSAWKFRTRRGFDYEELHAEGLIALVEVARRWEGRAQFRTYAYSRVLGAMRDWFKRRRQFVPISGDESLVDAALQDWLGGAVLEGWTTLLTTPDKISEDFESIRLSPKLKDAWEVLSRREERMAKRFLTKRVRMPLAHVAREERMSYRKAMFIVSNSVRKLRAQIKYSQQSANDRFPVANIAERIDVPLLPSAVNNQEQPATGGGKCMRVTSIQDQAEF